MIIIGGVEIAKVAIINEWLEEFGGAERVCMALQDLFDEPIDIYALWNYGAPINSINSMLQHIPDKFKKIKGLLSLLIFNFSYRKKNYDLIISISHLFAHSVRFRKQKVSKTTRINYILTPARYIWQPEIDSRVELPSFIQNFLRIMDRKSIDENAIYVAISSEVQNRVKKFWDVNSAVIYPPVDIEYFRNFSKYSPNLDGYLLSAGRFVKYKNHAQAIYVAASLNRKIILAGDGPERRNLEHLAQSLQVKYEIWISPSREQLARLFAEAAVFLHPCVEDFGIMPIEAMATGTPVVGLAKGGLLDTVNKKSGVLVNSFEELPAAVERAEKLNRSVVADQALRFDKSHFIEQFKILIKQNESTRRGIEE